MFATIVNLTPHALTIVVGEATFEVPPSGQVARVSERQVQIGTLALAPGISVPLVTKVYGDVEGLPEADGVSTFVVSSMVKARCPDRPDVVAPADLARDDAGRVVGARALAMAV